MRDVPLPSATILDKGFEKEKTVDCLHKYLRLGIYRGLAVTFKTIEQPVETLFEHTSNDFAVLGGRTTASAEPAPGSHCCMAWCTEHFCFHLSPHSNIAKRHNTPRMGCPLIIRTTEPTRSMAVLKLTAGFPC